MLYINEKENREEDIRLDGYKVFRGNLDLSDFANLKWLDCSYNRITSLNLNNCPYLEKIWCSNNQLTNLDVSNCSCLTELDCSNNLLTNITLSNNPASLK